MVTGMPTYFFHIRQGKYASSTADGIELADVDAARQEAAMMCSDMARDIVSELDESPEWQMEVTDASGKIVYRLTLLAEVLEDGQRFSVV
ncbi:MAG: hypothetical protein JWR89_4028 [Tardiphaga sp.]|jgi:hypothetical protein|nr:hypothetical protein [Tardiphaga sp.]